MAEKALRGWGVDLVAMNNVTDGHALYVHGDVGAAAPRPGCGVQR